MIILFKLFFEIPSVNIEYCADLTLFQHRLFLREARKESKKVDIIALSRAREKIRKLFKDMWHSRKIQTRVRAANLQQSERTI